MNEQVKKYLQDLDKAIDEISDEELVRLVKASGLNDEVAKQYAVLETSVLGCSYVGKAMQPMSLDFSGNEFAEAA